MSFDLTQIIILIDYYTKFIRDLLEGILANLGRGNSDDADAE